MNRLILVIVLIAAIGIPVYLYFGQQIKRSAPTPSPSLIKTIERPKTFGGKVVEVKPIGENFFRITLDSETPTIIVGKEQAVLKIGKNNQIQSFTLPRDLKVGEEIEVEMVQDEKSKEWTVQAIKLK